MKSNLADQSAETVVQLRWGPGTNRPLSSPQPLWVGRPPEGVKKILTRDALAQHHREHYAKWATNFALLSDEFLAQVFERELDRIKQLTRDKWTTNPFVDWHYCEVGGDYLWVQEQKDGSTVELCYPDADPDVRILTTENMPVLCPEGIWGARLALACYPKPPPNLAWHSYW